MMNSTPAAPNTYVIPEFAHADLVQLRNHLQLMSLLTAHGPDIHPEDLRNGLAWWFARLEKEIEGVLDVTEAAARA